MQFKRLKKWTTLQNYVSSREDSVVTGGAKNSETVLVTWGSTWGTVLDVAEEIGLKVVRPLFLEPFPWDRLMRELAGARKILCLECSLFPQLDILLTIYGIDPHRTLKKYNGRPFFRDELLEDLGRIQ
jgi:2-oxoglutarate ferredoxin oxidoreductase subunit alpha